MDTASRAYLLLGLVVGLFVLAGIVILVGRTLLAESKGESFDVGKGRKKRKQPKQPKPKRGKSKKGEATDSGWDSAPTAGGSTFPVGTIPAAPSPVPIPTPAPAPVRLASSRPPRIGGPRPVASGAALPAVGSATASTSDGHAPMSPPAPFSGSAPPAIPASPQPIAPVSMNGFQDAAPPLPTGSRDSSASPFGGVPMSDGDDDRSEDGW